MNGPLFVVGAARSGTKLLRALLDAHPAIAIPDVETSMVPLLAREWGRFGDLAEPGEWERFTAWAGRFLYFREMAERGRAVDPGAWRGACRSFDLAGVYEALVRLGAGVGPDDDVIWGDKSPGHLVHLPLLHRIWPGLRVVHIVRDGRDVALSSWEAWGKHPLRTAQRWNDEVRVARADGARLGAAYHELRFEDLVAEPEAVLGRICAFLGVAYDGAMLAASSGERGGTAKGKAGVFGDAGGRWRRDLDAATRRGIEEIGGALLAELGYELPDGMPEQRRAPAWRLAMWQASDGTKLLGQRLKEWGVAGVVRYGWRTFRATRS